MPRQKRSGSPPCASAGGGAGQVVGTIEAGANPEHPDLQGKFAHTCAMGPERRRSAQQERAQSAERHRRSRHHRQRNLSRPARMEWVCTAWPTRRGPPHTGTLPQRTTLGNNCDPYDNCPPGVSDRRHQWSELFDQETARGIDWVRALGVRATNFSWGRTYEWSREKEDRYGLTASTVRSIMPETLEAFEAYVGAGGVAVWAAGKRRQPASDSGGHAAEILPGARGGVAGSGWAWHRRTHRVLLPRPEQPSHTVAPAC